MTSTVDLSLVIDVARLEAWMDAAGLGHGAIRSLEALTGGTQNILLRFVRAGRVYVLRRPPAHPRAESQQTMQREARLLGALAGTDVPHARLIAACADEASLGFAFYLMELVDGFNATEGLTQRAREPDFQRAMGLSLVDALAAVGRIDPREAGLEGFGKPEGFLARQVGRWRAQLDSYAQYAGWHGAGALPDVDGVAAWLDDYRPAQFVPGILHGDFHLANVMFDPASGRVAAIVDWELATLGDPLLDLGWLLATWPQPDGSGGAFDVHPWTGFPTAEVLVERYAQGSARILDAMPWYEVLACYKLGILQEGTMARAQAGQASLETGERLHGLAVRMFDRAHARMAQFPTGRATPSVTGANFCDAPSAREAGGI